jgi:hypothetical protein
MAGRNTVRVGFFAPSCSVIVVSVPAGVTGSSLGFCFGRTAETPSLKTKYAWLVGIGLYLSAVVVVGVTNEAQRAAHENRLELEVTPPGGLQYLKKKKPK